MFDFATVVTIDVGEFMSKIFVLFKSAGFVVIYKEICIEIGIAFIIAHQRIGLVGKYFSGYTPNFFRAIRRA